MFKDWMALMPRILAKLVDWKDDKGYGFARLPGGTERVFVHARAFEEAGARPRRGDDLEVDVGRGAKGLFARTARILSLAELQKRLPMHVVTASVLFILVNLAIIRGMASFDLAYFYALAGGVSYWLYHRDKVAARQSRPRVPEWQLLLADLLGGVIGGLLAQHRLWHKTSKPRFQRRTVAIVILHAGLLGLLGAGALHPESWIELLRNLAI